MTSAATSGALTGAASGAATGMMFGPWGAAIGGVIGGVAGLFSGSQTDASMANSTAWAGYNAQMQKIVDTQNVLRQTQLAGINVALIKQEADRAIEMGADVSRYNELMVQATTDYNSSLLDQEEALLWEAAGLDLEYLEIAREQERGSIIAQQSASGTVIGEGTNADVLIQQGTQEAIDAFVIRHNADIRAAEISDRKALNEWQGQVAIDEIRWQGEMGSYIARNNANTQIMGLAANTMLSAGAQTQTIDYRYQSSLYGIQQSKDEYAIGNNQNMVNGLFSAAGTAANVAYATKSPDTESLLV